MFILCITDFRTLTTPVEFLACLRSIKEHAFATSPYPVVITLEDHLTTDLQAKAAQVSGDLCACVMNFLFTSSFSQNSLLFKT